MMKEHAEWTDENTRIICELFAEQVKAGNRPNGSLNKVGYSQVASKFEERTQLVYTKMQFKNKWDRLKLEYGTWNKLLVRGEGLGWNSARGTIAADNDWWKRAIQELPFAKKFRQAGMQNEDHLRVMFDGIISTGVDHMPVLEGSSPNTPGSSINVGNLDGPVNSVQDNDDTQIEHEPPSNRKNKRPPGHDNAADSFDSCLAQRTQVQMPEPAEWNDEKTRIICELFAEQVRAGNRPNGSLNKIGYIQVASKFEQRTQLVYSKKQIKNKWDKLKIEYDTWKKLLIKGAGLGWNTERGTIDADNGWWKNTIKELPGATKFRKAGIQNEDHLRVMFYDIVSNANAVDHTPLPASSSPSTPDGPINVANLDAPDNNIIEYNDGTQAEHEAPSTRNRKRSPVRVNVSKNKRNKTEAAVLMKAQLKSIAELAEKAQSTFEKFLSEVDSLGTGIQNVMALVRECGARSGSDEHFIATELFVSREQREMFLTLSNAEERLEWLRRKYNAQYGGR